MNIRVILNKCLVISYLSGQTNDMDADVIEETINDLLKHIALPESTFGINYERTAFVAIIDLIKDILRSSKELSYNRDKVLNELKVICGTELEDYYKSILKGFPKEDDTAEEKRVRLLQELNSATRTKREEDIRKSISAANIGITANSDKIGDLNIFVDELIDTLQQAQLHSGEDDKAIVNDLNFNENREAVEEVFQKHLDLEDDRTVWKLNWDKFNIAYQGGWRPGDTILFGAMQHNYKSSLTLSMFRGLAKYNKASAFVRDPLKKPMLSRISFEDSMVNNMAYLALNILWNEAFQKGDTEVPPDISNLDKKDLADIVMNDLTSNGWMIHMARIDGDSWSYKDLIKKVLTLESQGYDMRAMVLDYFLLISKKFLGYDTTGSDARNLLRKLRGFWGSKDILGITPAQLAPAVKRLISDGVVDKNDLLDHICDLGMFSESSKLTEEPEGVFYINKVKYGDTEYLHCLIEKHRYIRDLGNDKLKSFYLKFPSNGLSIPDDPDGKLGVGSYSVSQNTLAGF